MRTDYDIIAKGLEKQAVSVGRTLAVLRNRMAQGARVAPGIVDDLAKAPAGATTPAMARRVALNASDDAKLQQRMVQSRANPVVQGTQQRLTTGYNAAVRRDPGVFSETPLASHYDHGPAGMTPRPVAYARVHADSLVGNSQIQDPKGLMLRAAPQRHSSSGTSATVALTPRKRA
jgi:hypothetical protein